MPYADNREMMVFPQGLVRETPVAAFALSFGLSSPIQDANGREIEVFRHCLVRETPARLFPC